MIDGYLKKHIDQIWNKIAYIPVKLGMSANQVTFCGLVLMLGLSLSYPFWKIESLFGALILLIFAFDSLDGAVARITKTSSKFGGYFDAIVDRYQEVAVLAALAYSHDCWPEAFFLMSGSLLVSYTKARVAIECEIENDNWPDLMERLERVLALSIGLMIVPFIPWPESWEISYISTLLLGIGVLTHFTALQRFMRAKQILSRDEK